LIRYNNGHYNNFSMNGPLSTSTFALYYYNNTILANAGGYNSSIQATYNYSGFYQFENQEKWVNYNRFNSNYPTIPDNVVSAYNPYDDSVYIGHFGAGLVSWNKSDKFIIHDTSNTILVTGIITGLDVDTKGTLWMSAWICFDCDQTGGSVYSKTKKGVWTSYTLTQSYEDKYLIQLKLDLRGNKWLRYGGSGLQYGLIVFNENGNQERHFSATDGLPDAVVNCIEVDKKGVVWIGTGKGLAGFYEPSQAFTGNFIKPIYNGFPILFDKNVTCIKSDGGNRKWVGTTEGLWLFNDDFSKAISFFDVNNSPLYSNNIIALEIHELTGELFIATDEGIISYRPDASEEQTDLKSAHIFPNPVKPDYAGLIAIDGLQDNAVVKITDTQGKLFYETKATGGTATWNMVNYAGIKAESGMYLVFVSTEDGGEKYVGKIAIVQ
ncbi:MAG: T9SS type A sorting domain-containing protein, partial [Cytophagales bacterium]|nr:T9SS type A sorting domain-containing protein [Cytophaga sp.]